MKKGHVGSWENTSPKLPAQFKDIKHITPTHYTWVTYDAKTVVALATSGGTWRLEGLAYTEKCEFVSPGYEHLKGNEYTFLIKFEGNELSIKSGPGSNIDIDEVWRRMKREK